MEALVSAQAVVGVVTQPDRPAGRGREMHQSAVKKAAVEHSLAVYQPRSLRTPEAVEQLAAWHPDVVRAAKTGI